MKRLQIIFSIFVRTQRTEKHGNALCSFIRFLRFDLLLLSLLLLLYSGSLFRKRYGGSDGVVCGDNNEIVAKLELNSLFYFHFSTLLQSSHKLSPSLSVYPHSSISLHIYLLFSFFFFFSFILLYLLFIYLLVYQNWSFDIAMPEKRVH